MINAISITLLGFFLGMRHALDPDHVVAVTAITAQQRSLGRAVRAGALWGVGHTGTILLVGGAIVAFRWAVPPRIGLALEFGVALMLIVLGFQNLRHGGVEPVPSTRRPLVVGMVHGLAGSAAVALLVLATVRESWLALAYLVLVGLGTVVGMALVTLTIAAPMRAAAQRWPHSARWLAVVSGVVSVAFGLVLASQLMGPDGVFSAAPSWSPR